MTQVTPNYTLHWAAPTTDSVTFAIEASNGGGWVAVGFPKIAGKMDSDAVIFAGPLLKGSAYKLVNGKALADTNQAISETSSSVAGGQTVVKFSRKLYNGGEYILNAKGKNNLIWAYGPAATTALGYHSKSRGGFVVDLSLTPPIRTKKKKIHFRSLIIAVIKFMHLL